MAEQVQVMSQAVQSVSDREGKYLTFSLDREEYGIGILKVKEIIGMMRITPVYRLHSGDGQGRGSVKILLDIDKVLSARDIATFELAA